MESFKFSIISLFIFMQICAMILLPSANANAVVVLFIEYANGQFPYENVVQVTWPPFDNIVFTGIQQGNASNVVKIGEIVNQNDDDSNVIAISDDIVNEAIDGHHTRNGQWIYKYTGVKITISGRDRQNKIWKSLILSPTDFDNRMDPKLLSIPFNFDSAQYQSVLIFYPSIHSYTYSDIQFYGFYGTVQNPQRAVLLANFTGDYHEFIDIPFEVKQNATRSNDIARYKFIQIVVTGPRGRKFRNFPGSAFIIRDGYVPPIDFYYERTDNYRGPISRDIPAEGEPPYPEIDLDLNE